MILQRLPDKLQAKLNAIKHDVLGMVRAGYFLGEHVAKEVSESGESSLDILLQVAAGERTLLSTGAELRKRFPEHPARDDIELIRSENQDTDRIMAHLVIESLQREIENK